MTIGTGKGGETGELSAGDSRRRFGEELRSHRELYGPGPLTQTELGRLVRTSKSTISRLESTDSPIPPGLPELFDQLFATKGLFKSLYEDCVAATFPAMYRRRMRWERQAEAIWDWSPTIVPGLFQTAAYAHALLSKGAPRATAAQIEADVAKRLARQVVLRSTAPPDVRVVLCESVLMRRIAGAEVMREQLTALLDHGTHPTTQVNILPLSAEAHLLIDNAISVLTLPNHVTKVCVEAFRTAGIIEEPEDVRVAVRAYTDLLSEALSAQQSASLIAEHLEKL
ncbi:helix-turn-helix transcriptional regulator [Streptomyces sp. NPDC093252]|uniref:helix-turn-helix transcriptional regulator n=1 Tax=Streptomyces sp. NPDC093252 TaxID=3154980 RepID=UPI00342D3FA4